MAETHACLLAAARERAGTKYIALDSLEAEESEQMDIDNISRQGVSLDDLATEAKGLGFKTHLASGSSSSKESPRAGWEDNLAIYIRDVSCISSLKVFDYYAQLRYPARHCADPS